MINNSESNFQSHLMIQLAGVTYAIHVSRVYQISGIPPITKVPQTPVYMLGVMESRERLLPVIDLRLLYGIEAIALSKHSAIIITACTIENEIGGDFQDFGLLVDSVVEVTDIDIATIEHPLLPGNSNSNSAFSGFVRIGGNAVMILDVDNLLNSESIAQLKSFVTENMSI